MYWQWVKWFYDPRFSMLCRWAVCIGLFCVAPHALAGSDVLEGTLSDVNATLQGSGRKWIYLIEGISALIAYRSTKNVYVLGSVIAVAIFVNILLIFSR